MKKQFWIPCAAMLLLTAVLIVILPVLAAPSVTPSLRFEGTMAVAEVAITAKKEHIDVTVRLLESGKEDSREAAAWQLIGEEQVSLCERVEAVPGRNYILTLEGTIGSRTIHVNSVSATCPGEESIETQPAEPEPTVPEETKPAPIEPEETQPALTEPEESKSAEIKPAPTEPALPEVKDYQKEVWGIHDTGRENLPSNGKLTSSSLTGQVFIDMWHESSSDELFAVRWEMDPASMDVATAFAFYWSIDALERTGFPVVEDYDYESLMKDAYCQLAVLLRENGFDVRLIRYEISREAITWPEDVEKDWFEHSYAYYLEGEFTKEEVTQIDGLFRASATFCLSHSWCVRPEYRDGDIMYGSGSRAAHIRQTSRAFLVDPETGNDLEQLELSAPSVSDGLSERNDPEEMIPGVVYCSYTVGDDTPLTLDRYTEILDEAMEASDVNTRFAVRIYVGNVNYLDPGMKSLYEDLVQSLQAKGCSVRLRKAHSIKFRNDYYYSYAIVGELTKDEIKSIREELDGWTILPILIRTDAYGFQPLYGTLQYRQDRFPSMEYSEGYYEQYLEYQEKLRTPVSISANVEIALKGIPAPWTMKNGSLVRIITQDRSLSTGSVSIAVSVVTDNPGVIEQKVSEGWQLLRNEEKENTWFGWLDFEQIQSLRFEEGNYTVLIRGLESKD